MMDVSLIIPTRGRPERLAFCLDLLSGQTGAAGGPPPAFEVLIALDGPDDASARAVAEAPRSANARAIECARLGVAHAKNRAIDAASGRLLLFLNDDVAPAPDLVARHASAHERWAGDARWANGVTVVGWSPWVVREGATLLHRLLRDTSMVFFYDRMAAPDGRALRPADHDWGFRHAWTLNYSAPADAVRRVGGYRDALANCCFEDLELAYRLGRGLGLPVLFEPRARAPHDHPYTPEGYLERERRLGYSAYGFASAAPACAREVYGRDLSAPEELAYAAAFVEREARDGAASLEAFVRAASLPADGVRGPGSPAIIDAIARLHTPLKRLAFRRGLLLAASNGRIPGLFHPSDGLRAEPGAGAPASATAGAVGKTP